LRQQGLELDVQYSPVEPLMVTLGYAYLDSEFQSYDHASQLPGVSGTQDLSGIANRNSPEHKLNFSAQWTQPLGQSGMNWFARVETMWTDEANVGATTNNDPMAVQDAYALSNLRFGLAAEDERWSVSAFMENLSDEEYCVGVYDQPAGALLGVVSDGGTLQRCIQGDPRTVGVKGTYYFE